MKTTQKVILGCALAVSMVSGFANAASPVDVELDVATADPTPVTVAVGDFSNLIQTKFVFTRSRNVAVHALANAAGTGIAISTASVKGRNTFFTNSGGYSSQVCGLPALNADKPTIWTVTDGLTETPPNCAAKAS